MEKEEAVKQLHKIVKEHGWEIDEVALILRVIKNDERLCEICFIDGKIEYLDATEIPTHSRLRHKDCPYKCKHCKLPFEATGTLGKHVTVVHEDPGKRPWEGAKAK